ncbi:MAG: hypothetical protein SOX57_02975 [Schaalia hyovaginalis]|uniref:hypothetical protein n=1 Tax=Schaalia hyovaginalis TaxID=29316 RepID=UPI0026F2B80A|nr:hypothetical protein [Schaalia hyovaginalis]MCI6411707.1 hypothetical protein [Schaalia hyovaginalis]MCI7512491.1 hypothetical protein [Schaalia hyovaginalis]MDY3665696.1 hypothetical protein [Schaalia hyovaginalis]MDY4262290.1 hypothetical protein [Schaalia hyovaginalis]
MADTSSPSSPLPDRPRQPVGESVQDDRRPSLGLGRIVMAAFWAVGIWTGAAGAADLLDHSGPWGPSILTLLAGVVYLMAAAGITHNGRRMRILGWACIGTSIGAPLILWVAALDLPELSEARSAWTGLGADFHFIPLAVSLVGLVWMWLSNPRRIVEIAEQIERPSRSRR